MGKVLSIVLGASAALVGVILLISWWGWFLRGLMAVIPAMLIFGGIIALIAGVSEMKDAAQSSKEK
jgi:succinate-acetate transporter protein